MEEEAISSNGPAKPLSTGPLHVKNASFIRSKFTLCRSLVGSSSRHVAHQPMAWPDRWRLGQGHDMYNLGAVWICKRCWGIVRPPADEVSTKLMNTCTGHTSNGSKKFGLLLPKECPVAFSVPQQLKPVQVQHAVQHHTQQSKLRLFFGNSVRKPREEVVSPSADKSRASSSDLTAQSCPLGRAQLRVRAEFDQEEVPSPPNNNQDGEAVQGGPVKVGQRQRQPRKRPVQASPECLPGGSVQGTGNVAICSGAAQGSPGRLWPRAKSGQELERERSCGSKNRKKKRKGWQQIEHASLRPHLWVQEHQSDAQKRGGRRQSALKVRAPPLPTKKRRRRTKKETRRCHPLVRPARVQKM